MSKIYDYIFFDLDGTILDDKMRHYHCYADIVNKLGGNVIDPDTYWSMKRHKIPLDQILQDSSMPNLTDEFLIEWRNRIENEAYLKYAAVKPHAVDAINYLKNYAGKMYIVTMRHNRNALLNQLKILKLDFLFDGILSGDTSSKSQLVKSFVIKNPLVLGDTEADMKFAEEIHAQFFAITDGIRDEKFLKTNKKFPNIGAVIGCLE